MERPVYCRCRHRFIHEDTAPGADRMVTGDDEAFSFVPVGDKLEQHPRFCIIPLGVTGVVYHYHTIAITASELLR